MQIFVPRTQVSGSGRGGCSANRKADLPRLFASPSPLSCSATRLVSYLLGGCHSSGYNFLSLLSCWSDLMGACRSRHYECMRHSGGWSCQKTVGSCSFCDGTLGRLGITVLPLQWGVTLLINTLIHGSLFSFGSM